MIIQFENHEFEIKIINDDRIIKGIKIKYVYRFK